jgi:hypothetical protein
MPFALEIYVKITTRHEHEIFVADDVKAGRTDDTDSGSPIRI